MSDNAGVVIVGGSIAGYNVARKLRTEGYEDKITIFEAKESLPYDRSELSVSWMLDSEKIGPPLFQKSEFFDEKDIDVHLNTKVKEFNPEEKFVITDEDEKFPYDTLVLAMGSSLRKLGAPGEEAMGVFYLRDHEDALEIKEWAKDAKKLAIIGAGFIGLELAASMTQLGLDVTVVEYEDHPLGNIIGEEASDYFVQMHEKHGVKFITGEGGKAFEKDHSGKLTKVITTEDTEISADMAIIGVGVTPNISVDYPKLDKDGAILVNEYGETSVNDVYAVGDVSVWPYKGEHIHVEHWEHAFNHGRTIAQNILEPQSHPYETRPYFWTDQYDQTFERLGHVDSWHKIIKRGSLDQKEFTLAYVDEENQPLAILFANNGDKRKEVTKFMNSGQAIDEAKFHDMENPL